MGENVYLVMRKYSGSRTGYCVKCYYDSAMPGYIRIRFADWLKTDPPLGTMKKDHTYIVIRVGPDDARAVGLVD